MKLAATILFTALLLFIAPQYLSAQSKPMNGISMVGPPNPFQDDPMLALKQLGANWIGIIPFAYTILGENDVSYDRNGQQWWGERPEGVLKTIQLAKENGLKILLKPQLYVPGSWPGDITFDNDQDWESWEAGYTEYILRFAKMAEETEVELFCIGTEFKLSLQQRPQYWNELIQKVKTIYSGKLTYAANWDEFFEIPTGFWKHLDYVGLDSYFPLSEKKTPSVKELTKAWKPIVQKIEAAQKKIGLPIIFTEYGYLSVDGCAGKAWEVEAKVKSIPINQQAQANAIEAMMQTFWGKDWWAGSFMWKWFPELEGHTGYLKRDYTPQGKLGQTVLKLWFMKSL